MLQISAELLAMSSDAAVLIKNGRLVFANAGAYGMLGPDCVGKSVARLFGDDIAGIQAGSYIGEFPLGSKRYIVRASAADGIRALFFSDTQLNESLVSDAFIYSLRSCLMSMDVALQLLRSHSESCAELRSSLSVISHESFRINRILSNIGIIQAAKREEVPFAPMLLDLSAFIETSLDSIRLISCFPEIRFSSPGEIKIYADPSLVECLLLNLVSNCIIHARDCSRISITLTPGRERAFISVDDDGCGIAPEELHGVFDRYTHSYDLSSMGKGPGLGLSAARAIADIHGGTLLMESRPGIGTAVRVSLGVNPHAKPKLNHPALIQDRSFKSLLTGLADCLGAEYFEDKFLD